MARKNKQKMKLLYLAVTEDKPISELMGGSLQEQTSLCQKAGKKKEKTNIGRVDAVLDADSQLYIIEFKLNKTAGEALGQIDDKKYTQKYILPAREKGQTIHKLGINFCYGKEVRNISEWGEE